MENKGDFSNIREKHAKIPLKNAGKQLIFHASVGLFAFGILGGALSLLFGFTRFDRLKVPAILCFFLPIPLFFYLLLYEKRRRKMGESGRFSVVLPFCALPFALYACLCAASYRFFPLGLGSLLLTVGSGAAAYFSGSLLLLRLFFEGSLLLLSRLEMQKEKEQKTQKDAAVGGSTARDPIGG